MVAPAPPSQTGIADGLRVIEIGSSVSVAVAGVALADAGAEVVMIEPPSGTALRGYPAFAMWARGKHSVVADLATDDGRTRTIGLLRDADVCLLGLKAASADRFGLDYESLSSVAPQLVVGSLSGFGRSGPYRTVPVYDGVMQARGGRMVEFSLLTAGERPVFAAAPVAAHSAAAALVLGVYAALAERERNGGRGQLIETSLAHALSVYDLSTWAPGAVFNPKRDDVPYLAYATARTADGEWVQFAQNGPALFADFIRVLGLDDEFDAATLTAAEPEVKRKARLRIHQQVASKTLAQWQKALTGEHNLSVEKFWKPGEALDHPQFTAIGDVVTIEDSERGTTRQLGPLFDVPSRPLQPAGPAPTLGASNTQLERTGGRRFGTSQRATAATGGGRGILAGITVLELGMWIALPFACTQLAELGARVIKLEPIGGDPMRPTGPSSVKIVQGKESVMLDMKDDRGRKIVHELVARADVLMHSYRPGVPERLGIDFDTVRSINPQIVYVYNGSYGSRGPKAYAPAFHVTGGAVAGGAYAQAGAGCPPPPGAHLSAEEVVEITRRLERSNEANPDFNSAVVAAAAAAMGLYARNRSGEAIAIETRMMLSCGWMMSPYFVDYPGRPPFPEPDAAFNGPSARYRLYPAADGWVFVAAPRRRELVSLLDGLGLGALLSDERFATDDACAVNDEALAAAIGGALARDSADALEARLTKRGIACVRADYGPYGKYLFEQQWARDHGLVVHVTESMLGSYDRYGPVVSTANPYTPTGAQPAGRETRLVLGELGYSPADIDALLSAGVVAEAS